MSVPATDGGACERLVTEHMPLIRGLAWRRILSWEGRRVLWDAEDVAQEIALRAVRDFHRYDPAALPFARWLGRIARCVLPARRPRNPEGKEPQPERNRT